MTRMITTKIGEYLPAEWDGKNTSGLEMLGEEVLILPDQVPEQTKGGLFLPSATKEVQGMAAQTGVIVALGVDAWAYNRSRTRPFTGKRPEVGDRVVFDRYGGTNQPGLDGRMYLIMSDMVISGKFTEAEAATDA
jgi:co-chaperonin GroES (HSP10)